MSTRHVTIPENASFCIGELPWSFMLSLAHIINTDDRFNRTGAGIRAGARVERAFEGHDIGDTVQLGEEDWRMLYAAYEAPTAGWCPELTLNDRPLLVPGRTWLPYIDALSDERTREPPKKPEAEPAASKEP